jgi:hypothetical protein
MTAAQWEDAWNEAPTFPGDTCPVIDQIKVRLDAIEADLALVRGEIASSRLKAKDELVDQMHYIDRTLAGVSHRFEELRADNANLRASGRYWYRIARDWLRPADWKAAMEVEPNTEHEAALLRAESGNL